MIKFFDKTDLAHGLYVDEIKNKINNYDFNEVENINIILEYYNIIKYYNDSKVKEYLDTNTQGKSIRFIENIRNKFENFIYKENKSLLSVYDEIDFMYLKDFWEIFSNKNFYKKITREEFSYFLNKIEHFIYAIFNFEKIVEHFPEALRTYLLKNKASAEFIILKYFNNSKDVFIPKSLDDEDKNKILKNYIESEEVNINFLKYIIHMPSKQINISDKVKLLSKRRLNLEENNLFKNIENKMNMGIRVGWGEEEKYIEKNGIYEYEYNLNWIKNNLDYSTLLNNFIYIFEMVDSEMRLNLISKKTEIGIYEKAFLGETPFQYNESFVFYHKANKSNLEMRSYYNLLHDFGIKIEDIIEWFFKKYLLDEFKIKDFITKMPNESLSYFEKCRVILPEIDRILKQYNYYLKDKEIDQELLQISSKPLVFKECGSLNHKKYVYMNSKRLNSAAYIFYSNQSTLVIDDEVSDGERSFINILLGKELTLEMFEKYQIQTVNWLINEGFIHINKNGILKISNYDLVYILKEFYYKEVISYWHLKPNTKKELDKLLEKDEVIFENKLFTKGEIDYLNYYLNKSSFGNSLDLRNRYVHGTHSNNEDEHMNDYYIFLKILIIIIIKINDDLCLSIISNKK